MRTAGFTGRLAERIIYQDTDKGVLEMDFLTLEQSVWPRLQEEKRPIVLYGMGDGADKILRQFERLGIQAMNLCGDTASAGFGCIGWTRWSMRLGRIS